MNAPENIPSLRSEIAQHLADVGEATAKQLTEALIQDRLAVTHALHDMIKDAEVEREKKRGNEYVYWLSAVGTAPKKAAETNPEAKPASDFATSPELQYLAPEDYEMPPADPALLARANRALSEQLDEYRVQLSRVAIIAADYLPDPSNITTARAVEIMDMLIDEQIRVVSELRAMAEEQDQSIDSLTKDVINTRTALTNALNEADRLRRELTDAQEVTDAAVGYLVRVTKRKPRYIVKPERAREAALAAVRAGAGRAEVLAVVPVGVARRGAEWRGSVPRTKGD